MSLSPEVSGSTGGMARSKLTVRAEQRRQMMVELLAEGLTVGECCERIGVSPAAYRQWRARDRRWAAKCDEIRLAAWERRKAESAADVETPGFGEFRQRFFGHWSPWFHLEAIDAYENTPAGNITLMLWPPEHGKTTLFEDYAGHKLAVDPSTRFSVGSESQQMSRKILRRVKHRMDPAGPCPDYVARWGPFVSDDPSQPWGADYFDVAKKDSHDERDYSMVALGITSQIAGTRTDHLHADDIQSLKTYNRTADFVEKFRQDWLSRPGESGRTTINGTRVGPDDFYEKLEEEIGPEILRIIRFPAIITTTLPDGTVEQRPLWDASTSPDGSGYTLDQLERMRKKVGEEAWQRNYMQRPMAPGSATFTAEMLEECRNPLWSLLHHAPEEGSVTYIGCDPSIGGRSTFVALQVLPGRRARVVMARTEDGLTSNQAIFAVIDEMCHFLTERGGLVTDVVFEQNAFQKGLIADQFLAEMRRRWGFSVRGHQTGTNKYDANIGIPSMALNFARGQIELPWADNSATRIPIGELCAELVAWRPHKRGTQLKQDLVMALWFAWGVWRERRGEHHADASSFDFAGLPGADARSRPPGGRSWALSGQGLIVPGRR